MRILALTKYGTLAASTRQRFLLYQGHLAEAGIELEISPLLDNDYLRPLMGSQKPPLRSIVSGYGRRLAALATGRSYDLLWIHCELFPYLPGFVESLAAGLACRPFLFDYDDAIFHYYDEASSPVVRAVLSGKLAPILRRASACLCGNAYLRDYAAQYCANSIILPTVVDIDRYCPAKPEKRPVTIGWIGSPSTWENVAPLLPMLERLTRDRQVKLRVVGAGPEAIRDSFPGLELIEWSEQTEIEELHRMDIGIMPLLDLPFQRGKSGYKLIQYMACGLPVVASPIGVNREIVRPNVNGFLATTDDDWSDALGQLIDDAGLRRQFGSAGRALAEHHYSLQAHAPRLIELVRSFGTSG